MRRFSMATVMPIPKNSVVVQFSEIAVPANFIGISSREPENGNGNRRM
jgi:hypothetical protein